LPINELIHQRRWKENGILQSWWGAISIVLKNWKLLVACLSGFWLGKMLLGHPEKDNVFCQNKKTEGTYGLDPLAKILKIMPR
jgi:hypothetical protein